MNRILLEETCVLEYIKYSLMDCISNPLEVINFRYHHNTGYAKATSILEHGILSMQALTDNGIVTYSKEILRNMSNTDSHVNGIDGISLSVTGLTDLSPKEDEWDPFNEHYVDFLIDDVNAYRSSINYGNEFIAPNSISNDKIKAVDIRILKYLKLVATERTLLSEEKEIKELVDKYNCLNDISRMLIENNLDIPLRENSDAKNSLLDVHKISRSPKIEVKSLVRR